MIIVSACLAGIRCRYDGGSAPDERITKMVGEGKAIPVCPEQIGGLPTPRTSAERRGPKVITEDGADVTKQFAKGADEGLRIARLCDCKEAVLKAKSPSCGCGKIYDGTFSGKLVNGDGTFTEILKRNGIVVRTDEDL
jgi:uncharacterized protein YbbK (DUF523 family)